MMVVGDDDEVEVLVIDFKRKDMLNHRGCKEYFSVGFAMQGTA
jgi:hypothetical protein